MESKLRFPVLLCYFLNDFTVGEKRLLTPQQNDVDIRLKQLETSMALERSKTQQLNASLQQTLQTVSDLKSKVINSIQHMVGFSACHTKSATLGIGQTVIFDKIISNVGQAYNVMDGEFRAPYGGLYTFSFTGMARDKSDMYLNLVKNGVYIGEIYSNTDNADSATLTINLYLHPGDAIWIKNNFINSHLHPSDYTCFSGMLVREG